MSGPTSERTTLHRYTPRAIYDRATVDAILEEGIVGHVGIPPARPDSGALSCAE